MTLSLQAAINHVKPSATPPETTGHLGKQTIKTSPRENPSRNVLRPGGQGPIGHWRNFISIGCSR